MSATESTPTTATELAAPEARELTDRIKLALDATWHLVSTAYFQRAWAALGYPSWDDYCLREFGTSRLRLPREERQEVVASLREQGLSIRAIASAIGVDRNTVRADLQVGESHPPGSSVCGPDSVHCWHHKPCPGFGATHPLFGALAPGEAEAIHDTLADDELAGPTDTTFDEAATAAVKSRITGTDGKSYPATPRTPQAVPKPTVAPGIPPHPATYPAAIIALFRDLIPTGSKVLDPFAGVGTIHELGDTCTTVGIELEPEWAAAHPDTICGDARQAKQLVGAVVKFDVIATSPAYGNRLADWYKAADPEARRSYAIDLGHELSDGSGAALAFDTDGEYERLHIEVWSAVVPMLRRGGLFLLNCKDFARDGEVMPVTGWHVNVLADLGLQVFDLRCLPAAGLPFASAKPISELVVVMRKV